MSPWQYLISISLLSCKVKPVWSCYCASSWDAKPGEKNELIKNIFKTFVLF